MQCRTCAAQVPSQAQVCPNCGTPVDVTDRPTQNIPISNAGLKSDASSSVELSEQQTQSFKKNDIQEQLLAAPFSNAGAGQVQQAPNHSSPSNPAQSRPFTPLSLPQSQGGINGLTRQGQPSGAGIATPARPDPSPIYPPPVSAGFTPGSRAANTKWKWIFVGIATIVVLMLVGGSLFAYNNAHQATVIPRIPSGHTLNQQAGTIIVDAQTATEISKGTVFPAPQAITTRFQTKQTIYVTFRLHLNGIDLAKNPLYVNTKFYSGTQSLLADDAQPVNKAAPGGYFSAMYYVPTQYGAAEIYLCHQRSCSDEELAQVVHFSVAQPKQ